MFAALRDEVSDLIATGSLRPAQGAVLTLRLVLAELFWEASLPPLACWQLRGFDRTVQVYRTLGLLSDQEASSLLAAGRAIRDRIGC
jgi:hypothetical protein